MINLIVIMIKSCQLLTNAFLVFRGLVKLLTDQVKVNFCQLLTKTFVVFREHVELLTGQVGAEMNEADEEVSPEELHKIEDALNRLGKIERVVWDEQLAEILTASSVTADQYASGIRGSPMPMLVEKNHASIDISNKYCICEAPRAPSGFSSIMRLLRCPSRSLQKADDGERGLLVVDSSPVFCFSLIWKENACIRS